MSSSASKGPTVPAHPKTTETRHPPNIVAGSFWHWNIVEEFVGPRAGVGTGVQPTLGKAITNESVLHAAAAVLAQPVGDGVVGPGAGAPEGRGVGRSLIAAREAFVLTV